MMGTPKINTLVVIERFLGGDSDGKMEAETLEVTSVWQVCDHLRLRAWNGSKTLEVNFNPKDICHGNVIHIIRYACQVDGSYSAL